MRFFILLLPVCFWGLRGADFTAAPSKGEKLAKQYCSGCHLYTPPTLFERAHWEKNILPRMALFMGLYPNDSTKAIYYGKAVVFPDKPMLTQSDFEAIRDFYLTKAPEKTMPSVAQAIGDTLPGAYDAEVADFDGDGDVDIAAIAFFPDFGQSKGRFVLLKQEKGRKMAACTFAQAEQGRWMVLDKGDPDHDGDMDLLLGAMTFEVAGRPEFVAKWKELGIPFIVLENKMK